jgi:hypothetical protein
VTSSCRLPEAATASTLRANHQPCQKGLPRALKGDSPRFPQAFASARALSMAAKSPTGRTCAVPASMIGNMP